MGNNPLQKEKYININLAFNFNKLNLNQNIEVFLAEVIFEKWRKIIKEHCRMQKKR